MYDDGVVTVCRAVLHRGSRFSEFSGVYGYIMLAVCKKGP